MQSVVVNKRHLHFMSHFVQLSAAQSKSKIQCNV